MYTIVYVNHLTSKCLTLKNKNVFNKNLNLNNIFAEYPKKSFM